MATNNTTTKKTTSTKNKLELTPFEKEKALVLKSVIEYKEVAEANVVTLIYKHPDLLRENKLELEEFSNNTWKVYFEISRELILVERKQSLDQITVNLFLSKHKSLEKKYLEYGGYETIENAMTYMKEENFYSYVAELHKWNAVLKLIKRNFLVDSKKLSEFCDMTAEEIYSEYEVYLNDIFANVDSDIKSYDISDGIYDLIDELNEGFAVGLPYYDMPILTKETGGQYKGSITLVGGLSNVGKSTFARTTTIPSIIFNKEKLVCFLNEDSIKKWQRELLVYTANVINKFDIQKHVVRDGKYTEEVKNALIKAADWIVEKTKDHTITIIPFQQYKTEKVIKLIKKYANMGVNYFLLDTFKMDAGKVSDLSWLDMQQKMVDINDCIKQEALNVHILITFQLAKGTSARQRYYTQDNIGVSKNIVDTASTCIMIRDLWTSEYKGEKQELKVYRLDGKNSRTKIPVTLDRNKHYQILFITKNREGSANQYQIVVEHDMSRNIMKEVGICNVPMDF